MSNTNKYTGKTIINEGIIEVSTITNGGVASPIGASTNASENLELNGGQLNYTGGSTTINRGITLGSKGGSISVANSATTLTTSGRVAGNGKLIKEGLGRFSFSGANTYTGGTIIRSGSIALTTDVANSSGLSADTITLQGGSLVMFDSRTTTNTSTWKLNIPAGSTGTLITDGNSTIAGFILGGGTLNYFTNFTSNVLNSDVSMFAGTINVTTDAVGGSFGLNHSKGCENVKINLNNLVTMLYRTTSNITIPVGDLTGFSNSGLGAGGTGPCTITWEIGARNANSSFNGKITDAQFSGTGAVAAIRKVGTGIWTLNNSNTYGGGTTIMSGTLMVNNATGSGLGTGAVNVLAEGTLSGTGSVSGSVTVSEGGVLSPGNGIGTFTINNNVNIQPSGVFLVEIDKTNVKNDQLNLTGTLTINGKLQITSINDIPFAAGDSF
ncbi:MAG: autotransporter-associated beta strand repeat-containing protein [Paludibacter sp.]|nr:autotransporter-associated beta strand repeat-containing protein [Paludibacter sp.]